nr:MAG TPA: hypothetical protein [Caudoviricetes sp.]
MPICGVKNKRIFYIIFSYICLCSMYIARKR